AQITHGGCFTFIRVPGQSRPLSASGGLNKIGLMSGQYLKRQMSVADMQRVAADFANGARLAREAGFDAVEIHMGHGYLLSQFLSPLYNKRRDDYGGSLANRLRFPRQVLRQVLDAVGTKGSPFGGTIAHGALVPVLMSRMQVPLSFEVTGFPNMVNYGSERLRFPSPVPAGSLVHSRTRVKSVEVLPRGTQMVLECNIHVVGQERPAVINDLVILYM